MPPASRFDFRFTDLACRLQVTGGDAAATDIFRRYLDLFPAFAGDPSETPRYTVTIHDVAARKPEITPEDGIFRRMREYFAAHYPRLDSALLDGICSPRFVPDHAARDAVTGVLSHPAQQGLSLQKDFLVCSDRAAGRVEAFADVASSVKEAWGFHALNFFKVFFFATNTVRLHGSGATAGDRCVLLLANTGGGKSTLKNFFLQATPAAVPFTDDSILARRGNNGFSLYQDPVEFLKWCYLPAGELADHVIPAPRAAITVAPTIYYLDKGETTHWRRCEPEEIFQRVNQEAFFQRGFLTQRFIPPPGERAALEAYFRNTRALLAHSPCFLLDVRYHDNYQALFAQLRDNLGLGGEAS